MKILYVALKYEYGDPALGFSFEHYSFYDTLIKMNGGRNKVIYFPIDQRLKEFGKEGMNRKLLESVIKEKPDLCFFLLYREEIKKETVGEITHKLKIPTLNWFADDHWRFPNFSRHWAPYFTWVATTDSKAVEKYHKIGYKNVIKTQWACNHFLCKPLNLSKLYDVSFLGWPHGNRKKIINKIRKENINIQCWGRDWPNGRVSPEGMVKIFSQSKINLGLTNSSGTGIIRSFVKIFLNKGDDKKIYLTNPKHWFDNVKLIFRKMRNQIKGRNFDVPGCRGFLITGDADNLRYYYEDGKEIIIFKDYRDLIQKIRYYLEHEKEREDIALAGYNRTMKEHTYEKRFNDIFKIMKLNYE